MFYSQFILAKKGPLGTIWIAAHLERKLRKNQVADTDIGVSVDSIICPEVPIALRLSSHLLVGVVRIYSRKVNYLFDDCSEALLKIKQAFRSTSVDLPPEESKAPYCSITLPETFDLDDFELPDNDIFQGNYVDHHTSTREQITLQDNMEGVVYSTSHFGLDERFGDGETSGLNLDEELFLHKVDSAGHATVSSDHQSSAHAATPKQDERYRVENLDLDRDLMDYAQAPCTPGLVEMSNLANVQEVSTCEDHIDDEDYPVVESVMNRNSETISLKSSHHPENAQLGHWSVPDDNNSVAAVNPPREENGNHLSDLEIENRLPSSEFGAQNISTDNLAADEAQAFGQALNLTEMAVSVSMCLDRTQELEDVNLNGDGVNGLSVLSEDQGECNGIIVEECAQDASVTISCLQLPGGNSDDNQTVPYKEGTHGTDVSVNSDRPVCSNGILELSFEHQGLSSIEKPEDTHMFNGAIGDEMPCSQVHILRPCSTGLELSDPAHLGGEVCNDLDIAPGVGASPQESSIEKPEDTHMFNGAIGYEMPCSQIHILRPCRTGLELSDPAHLGGEVSNDLDIALGVGAVPQESSGGEERIYVCGPAVVVKDDTLEQNPGENPTAEVGLIKDIHADSDKSCNLENNVIGGAGMLENMSGSLNAALPAPEKLLSVPIVYNKPRDLFLEATPGGLACLDESDARSRIIYGKKRSYTESTLTEQILISVESARVVRTKRSGEAIPDDDDLLSSILVGRRSSVLKVKPTPPPYEITSVKRKRQQHASRTSACKRKVLMDDTMVLHGDKIRQQLTNTEDIRRLRKKAPCTRPEISVILKLFLEDEIFSEPLCSGMPVALASLFSQDYNISRINVSKDDASGASALSSSDMKLISANESIENVPGSVPAVVVETNMRDCGEYAVVKENYNLHLDEAFVLTENNMDADNGLCAGLSITDLYFNPTDSKEEAGEPISSLPSLPQNLAENEIGCTNVPSEVVDIAPLTSSDKGVVADDDLPLDEAIVLTENKVDADNKLCVGPCITDLDFNPTGSQEEAGEPISSLPSLPHNLYENEIGWNNVPSKVIDIASLTSSDKGAGADALVEMDAAVVSSDDIRGVENLMLDASINGSKRSSNDVRFDTVNNGDAVKVNKIESNEKDGVQLEGAHCADTVEMERYYGEQAQCEAFGPSGEKENDMTRGDCNEPLCVGTSGGSPVVASSFPSEFGNVQGSFLDDSEYMIHQEVYPANVAGAEISGLDMQDYNDFNYSAAVDNTEFLNDDDEEVDDVTDDYAPNAEETRFTDNSGWSTRTRAVAKYLQTVFMREAEYDRKVIPIDNLLVGKTRKEASRMFFETLVLKTKDYIHVEQERPFQHIDIKPKMKLLKSDF